MIKALIVDDDKIVRKGMITVIQWEKFGIEVVGDVNSGESALEFIQKEPVDLLITDLGMPGMTGLELIKKIKSLKMDLWIVVLTFHDKFEYVQEALRLGAIDYILKTQLDDTEIDKVFTRIVEHINTKSMSGKTAIVNSFFDQGKGHIDVKGMFMLVAVNDDTARNLEPLENLRWVSKKFLYEIDKNAWLIINNSEESSETCIDQMKTLLDLKDWIIINIDDYNNCHINTINALLLEYKGYDLFYDYKNNKENYCISLQTLSKRNVHTESETINELRKQWASVLWIYMEDVFNKLIEQVENIRPPLNKLESILYSAITFQEQQFPFIEELCRVNPQDEFKFWEDWVTWLKEIRTLIINETQKRKYSGEIVKSIMKAVDYINNCDYTRISQEEVSKAVNMSRSYFSQCFKDIMGKPFNDYIKDMRIAKAMSLLLSTDKPIYIIAEQLGYQNEKYFSRLFFEETGMLPTKYRSINKKNRYNR